MNKLTLLELRLQNFKGIEEFVLQANGESVDVFGDNGSGKTTIVDGFNWLLFDKDSKYSSKFSIKTLDQEGKEKHHLEQSVEGVFQYNEDRFTLQKVFKEKWVTPRGSAEAEFKGHTTDYYINGVKKKKKEFEEYVAEVIKEDTFKLLTSPSYFNEQLHWKDRRNILIEACGDIDMETIVASNPELTKIDFLEGRTIDEHMEFVREKQKDIDKELKAIPVRIDEIKKGMPTDLHNKAELEAKLSDLNLQEEKLQEKLQSIKNGAESNEKKKEISDLELQLKEIENEHKLNGQNQINELSKELAKIDMEKDSIQFKLKQLSERIESGKEYIQTTTETMNNLRNDWHSLNKKQFESDVADQCPTCKQSLPVEQVEEAKKTALEHFNLHKSEELAKINENGKRLSAKVKEAQERLASLEEEYGSLTTKLNELDTAHASKQEELSELKKNVYPVDQKLEYQNIKNRITSLQANILDMQENIAEAQIPVREEILKTKEAIRETNLELSKFDQIEQANRRIEQLKVEQKVYASRYEDYEKERFLLEEYTRTKINLLESKINSKFKVAKFKLFNELVNGGIEETCITLYNGVPYESGLNNASKINVGIDILDTLQEHEGIRLPVFVDNAESVVELADIDTQVIALRVSGEDKTLRMEGVN